MLKFLLFIILFAVTGCQEPESVRETIRPVKTMVVPEPELVQTRIFPGKIRPALEVNLSFRVSNVISDFPVKKGQHLKTGDIIATLDPRDFEIALRNIAGSLEEARANLKAMLAGSRPEDIRSLESQLTAARTALDEAERQHERYLKLFETGAVARAVLDNARSRKEEARSNVRTLEMELEKALEGARQEDIEAMQARISSLEAGLDQARSSLKDSVLRAPFDGYVAEKYVDNHQNITAGQPIVLFQDVSRLEVTAGLPEQLMVQRDMIRSIHVRLETFPEHFFPARIREVSTDAVDMTMTYRLTTIMDRPLDIPVYPSMAADVFIAFGSETDDGFFTVPETALVSRDGVQNILWIFNPETETVSSRKVITGNLTRRGIQIVEGVAPGEEIIMAGADFLVEGQKVKVVDESGQ